VKTSRIPKAAALVVFSAIFSAGIGFVSELSPSASNAIDAARKPASSETPRLVPAVSPPEKSRGAGLWPREGERWSYRFERKVSAEFQNRPWLSLKMGGRASVEPLGVHGANRFYLLSFEVDRLELQGEAKKDARQLPALRAEVTPEGAIRELRLTISRHQKGAVADELKDAAKDLAAQWFFFSDETRLGKSIAKYETLAEKKDLRVIGKRIVEYPGRPELGRLDSNHEWTSATDRSNLRSRVERIEGSENFTVVSPTGNFDQKTNYRWIWIGTETVARLADAEIGEALPIAESSLRDDETERAKRRIDRADFRAIWAKLSALPSADRLAFFERARRALDAGQSELIAEILAGICGQSSTGYEWRTGIGILAASANPNAQKALVELYRESSRPLDEKLSILAGISASEGKPAAEWKEIFATELREGAVALEASAQTAEKSGATPTTFVPKAFDPAIAVREATLYALGSAIRKETDEAKRRDLEKVLWREVSDARTVTAQMSVLEAIGNSASKEFYHHIRTQAQSNEPRVRAKAVGAVRFLASELAKPIIDSARRDASPIVRKAAEWSRKYVESGASDPAK
jgi:hypothetical protein